MVAPSFWDIVLKLTLLAYFMEESMAISHEEKIFVYVPIVLYALQQKVLNVLSLSVIEA